MKLEVNEYYLLEDGTTIKNDFAFQMLNIFSPCKPICHIPKPLHQFLLQQINDYYVDKDFRLTVESVYGK